MRVLRRFPVSDEFNSDRKTFCVILDRNEIFEILNYEFFISGHVTPEDMNNGKSPCASNGSTFGFLRDQLPVEIAL